MKCGQPFILENNFENLSRQGLKEILKKYTCRTVTVTLTGDYKILYERFMERNGKPERHRGHVVNDCYPEKEDARPAVITYENFADRIRRRGMDRFRVEGPCIVVDTTDFEKVDMEGLLQKIKKVSFFGDLIFHCLNIQSMVQ